MDSDYYITEVRHAIRLAVSRPWKDGRRPYVIDVKSGICPLVTVLPALPCFLVHKRALAERIGTPRHVGRHRGHSSRRAILRKRIGSSPLSFKCRSRGEERLV